jgi:membrane-bound lytic murein transglycosylase B
MLNLDEHLSACNGTHKIQAMPSQLNTAPLAQRAQAAPTSCPPCLHRPAHTGAGLVCARQAAAARWRRFWLRASGLLMVLAAMEPVACAARAPTQQAADTPASAPAGANTYALRPEAMLFADDVAERRGLDRAWVRDVLGQARYLPVVQRLMLPPRGAAKNWNVYRGRFTDATHVRAGLRFWQRNRATLARAQEQFGVPPEIIVGIIGVETLYGRDMGSYRVIDTLATLGFDFPRQHPRAQERQAFFRNELEQLLALAQHIGQDPRSLRGSYAGAMGMPQFMPSAWAKHAIDFDGDGRIDLWNNEADVIGSVANYLKNVGWQPDLPPYYPVRLAPDADLDTLLAPDITPTFSAASFIDKGGLLEDEGKNTASKLALIKLENGDASVPGNEPSYVAGTENFYALTRYNWSSYYAMAVIELSQAVARALER